MTKPTHPLIIQGLKEFHTPKPKGEIDMIKEVRTILSGMMPEDKIVECFDNNERIREAAGRQAAVQMHQLNRFWNTQFCSCCVSMPQRLALIPDATPENWLQSFKTTCVPFISGHNLPVVI